MKIEAEKIKSENYTSKKVAILTTSRSDFGPMRFLINELSEIFEIKLIVAGSHFLDGKGSTSKEIEKEFKNNKNIQIIKLEAMREEDAAQSHVQTLSETQQMASSWFSANDCDVLIALGDRWELFGVTIPAFLHGIPIAHISGGEITEGAIDDTVRHAHTKLASLHFVANEEFAKNISLMGEEDWRISVVGECGLDQIMRNDFATSHSLRKEFGLDFTIDTLLVTFHPSTADFNYSVEFQINELCCALEDFPDKQIIFTSPGKEIGSDTILARISEFIKDNQNAKYIAHLGNRYYYSALRASKAVIGNSSSGLIEAPAVYTPTLNIGDRQKNRPQGSSVLNASYCRSEISKKIFEILSEEFQNNAKNTKNAYDPFGDGKCAERISAILSNMLIKKEKAGLLSKKFNNEIDPSLWYK